VPDKATLIIGPPAEVLAIEICAAGWPAAWGVNVMTSVALC
jgi:hypothetical protein